MSAVSVEHITLDDKGIARIADKRTKVIQIVMDKLAHGWCPEEIQRQHPHLSLAEIHAAFVYYYDHKDALDAQIQESLRVADELAAKAGESLAVKKLKAMGKLP